MRKVLSAVLLAGVLVLSQACGGDSGVTKEEAGQVFSAAAGAAGQVQGQVFSGMAQAPAADQVTVGDYTYEWTDNSFAFTGTVNSAEGGSASVEGAGTWDKATQAASFDFSLSFNAFAAQGILLDGVLEMSFSGSQQVYELSYSGDIEASGKVVGSITFDLTVKMGNGSIEYSGTVGGQKIGGSANYNIPSH